MSMNTKLVLDIELDKELLDRVIAAADYHKCSVNYFIITVLRMYLGYPFRKEEIKRQNRYVLWFMGLLGGQKK